MKVEDITAHLVRETEALAAHLKGIRPKDPIQGAALRVFAAELAKRGPDAIDDIADRLERWLAGDDGVKIDYSDPRAATALVNARVLAEIEDKSDARDFVALVASLARMLFTAV